MKIASYNIRKARGLDQRRVPSRIIEVVTRLDADVVVLQEADLRLGARPTALPREMIAAETDYQVAPVAASEVSLGWHGNAILVRRDLPIVDVARFALPGLEPRGAVSVTVGTKARTRVVGVHLGLLRSWRQRQLRTIRDRLDDAETARTVIAGDFNEWSDRHLHEPLDPGFRLIASRPSFPAAYPMAALDRIAHGTDLVPVASGVGDDPAGRTASDHLPVWADFAPREA